MGRAWSFSGWYCRRGETLSGPFRPEHIKKLVARGRLRLADRLWEKWTRGRESLFFPALVGTASGLALSPRALPAQAANNRGNRSRLPRLRKNEAAAGENA